jgi:F-type H+-transporting ATPase subunit b
MLEINYWFFAQLANFLILLFILNKILFQPLLRLFKEREDSTKGFLEEAKKMGEEQDDVLNQLEKKLAEGRSEAKKIFDGFSKEGVDQQKSAVESAQNESVEINRKAKADLESATEKASQSLKSDIETFSKQIVAKLVGA